MADKALHTVLEHMRRLAAVEAAASDGELLERFVSCRDEAAFTALVQRHAGLVLGVCTRVLHRRHDAEDASQATFLVLAGRAASIRKRTGLASWLHSVAYRIAHKQLRAQARRRAREDRARTEPSGSMPRDPSWQEVQAALDDALMALPEKYRAPLVLCYLNERTRDEAAQQLGLTLNTLRSRLELGRAQLRKQLMRRGITLSAALLVAALTESIGNAIAPAASVSATVQAALGRVAPSASVRFLADGAVRSLLPGKPMLAMAAMLALGIGAGAGIVGERAEVIDEPRPRDANVVASDDMRAKPAQRHDLYGDPLPPNAIARLGTMRFRVGGYADAVGFSPDGKQIFAHSDGSVGVWDTVTGKELRRETLVATLTPAPALGFPAPAAVRFGPDGRSLVTLEAAGEKHFVRVRNLTDMTEIRTIATGGLSWPRLTPDGHHLIALSTERLSDVEVWNLQTGTRVRKLTTEKSQVSGLDVARDGKTVAARGMGREMFVNVWDVETGKLRRRIDAVSTTAGILALSPDGTLVAVGDRDMRAPGPAAPYTLRVWEVHSGKHLCKLHVDGKSMLFRAIFAPDGTHVVTIWGDGVMRVWDARTGKLERELSIGQFGSGELAFTPDGQALTLAGCTLRLMDWPSLNDRQQGVGHRNHVGMVAMTPDGGTVITCTFPPLNIWDTLSGQLRHTLQDAELNRSKIHLLADGKTLMSADTDGTVRLWDLHTGKERRRMKGAVAARPIAVSDDGALFASVDDDHSTRVVAMATGRELLHVPASNERHNPTPRAAFTAGGRTFILWRQDHSVHVWDVASGKQMRQFEFIELYPPRIARQARPHYEAALSPDGRLMAFGQYEDGGFLAIHDVATGQRVRLVEGVSSSDAALPTGFSPDGRTLAWSDWKTPELHLLEVATGKDRLVLPGHKGRVGFVSFSADGSRAVSASTDTTALVWDVRGAAAARAGALDRDAAWSALAGDDAKAAYAVMCRLAATPAETVVLLRPRLTPAPRPDEKRLAKLLADLDSTEFAVRDAAQRVLAKLEGAAVPAMRSALQRAASLEMRRRLQELLDQQATQRWLPNREQLRSLRAIELLEMAGSADCRAILQQLTNGAPGALLTEEAAAALKRIR